MNTSKHSAHLTWLLVKNRLLAQTGLNSFRYEKDPKKKRKKLALMLTIILVITILIFYTVGLSIGYATLGLNDLIPGLALLLSSLLTLFFTMFKANGEFFGFKDYEAVMSLPFSTRIIVNSRFINMYLWNTLFSLLIMLPMGAVYAWYAQPIWTFYPMWLLGIFIASLIPTTIAAIFGAGVTAISAKFRYAKTIATVLSFALIIMILVGSMSLGSTNVTKELIDNSGNLDLSQLSSMASQLSDEMARFYPPLRLFTLGVVEGQFVAYALFCLVSIAWYVGFVYLLALRYEKINTAVTSNYSRNDYQLTQLHQSSMIAAIYKKTILRILKSTIAATNLLVGCVMAILAAGAILFVGPENVLQSMGFPDVLPILKSAAPFAIAAMISMTNTAAVSLALEGQNIWLIKSLPIPPKTLYNSYLLVNFTFTIPTSFICSLLLSLALKPSFLETAVFFLTPLVLVIATSVIGIIIGNRFAYYDWQEETQVVKQSMMSMLGGLGGLVVIGFSGAIVTSGILPLSPFILTILLTFIVGIITIILYTKESTRPIKE